MCRARKICNGNSLLSSLYTWKTSSMRKKFLTWMELQTVTPVCGIIIFLHKTTKLSFGHFFFFHHLIPTHSFYENVQLLSQIYIYYRPYITTTTTGLIPTWLIIQNIYKLFSRPAEIVLIHRKISYNENAVFDYVFFSFLINK